MNRIPFILALLITAASCEETITLEADQLPPQIVIEGLVTDQAQKHYVRVTRSNSFYDLNDIVGVDNALVTVEDDRGNIYSFEYLSGQNRGADGYYFSQDLFQGIVGATYTLTVTIDEEVYQATDVLKPVTSIDSLSVVLNRNEFQDPEDPGYYYEVRIHAREPQDREDYYLFKFFRNDSIIVGMETDVYVADDELLGENIDGIPVTGFYKRGDVARVEMYSLSRQGFIFYSDLYTLLTSDGGMFSPPPANPRTNLSNGALGYFQVSAADVKRRVVQ